MRHSIDQRLPDGNVKRYNYTLSDDETLFTSYPRHYTYIEPMFSKDQRLHRDVALLNPFLENHKKTQIDDTRQSFIPVVHGFVMIPHVEEFCDTNVFDMFTYKLAVRDSATQRDSYITWNIASFTLANILHVFKKQMHLVSVNLRTAAKATISNITKGLLGAPMQELCKTKTLYDRYKAAEVKKAKDFFTKLLGELGCSFYAIFRSPLKFS